MKTNSVHRNEGYVDRKEYCIEPPVDIYETQNEYVLKTDMPGVPKENVEISFNNNVLEIYGNIDQLYTADDSATYKEFSLCSYDRKFTVSDMINIDGINASYENGVLTVILPKREEAKPRKIEIKAQ